MAAHSRESTVLPRCGRVNGASALSAARRARRADIRPASAGGSPGPLIQPIGCDRPGGTCHVVHRRPTRS